MTIPAAPVEGAPILLPEPPCGGGSWRIHVYAHTHWDREWYLPFERFRMQLVGAIDRVLDTLAADDRFTTYVLDGQTIVLDDYLEVRPEREAELRTRIREGRIEIGPWYILPDEFLVSGESLVRNLLVGRRGARRFTEHELPVGYLPDPFGHVAQLPQVLSGFGIDSFIFSRGMGDEFERLGTEFRWISADGQSSVLAMVQTATYTNGYCNAEWLAFAHGGEAGTVPVGELARELGCLLAGTANTDVLLFAAGVDHETVNPRLPVLVEQVGEVFGNAHARIGGLGEYVQAVHDRERERDAAGQPLATFSGELRGSRHAPILAAIFSARIPLKQDNALLQTCLERYVEPMTALAAATGAWSGQQRAFVDYAWKLALQNQPHDSIGGCSVDATHEDMPGRTKRALEVCQGLVEELQVALRVEDATTVFNPHGVATSGIASMPDGTATWLQDVPPLQLVALESVAGAVGRARILDERTIESDALRVHVTIDGSVQVTARQPDGQHVVLADALRFVDTADGGDEYDFGALPGDEPLEARLASVEARLGEGGVAELELRHELKLPRSLDDARTARAEATVRHELVTLLQVAGDQPWVECRTSWENLAQDHRLRLLVQLGERAEASFADGHFAVIERPVELPRPQVQWRQDPVPTQYMEAFAAIETSGAAASRPSGVAVLGRGLHEYEVVPAPRAGGSALAVTILRSVGWLSRGDVEGRRGHAGPALEAPGGQCLGPMEVEYAIAPFAGSWQQAGVASWARRFQAPLLVVEPVSGAQATEPGQRARRRDILIDVGHWEDVEAGNRLDAFNSHDLRLDGIELSTIKLAEDGSWDLVVRGFNPCRDARATTLSVGMPHSQVRLCRLDETPIEALGSTGTYTDDVAPGTIRTWRISVP